MRSLRPTKVLLAEDEPAIAMVTGTILQECGRAVLGLARSVRQALELVTT